jgi:hypothetical protein
MAINKYEDEIKIDKYNLDEELVRQAQLYVSWALRTVRAEKEADLAQREYELIKSEYEKRIKKNPKAYGLKDLKLTEALVKGEAERQPKVKRLYNRYIKALDVSKKLKKIENGFQQRKGLLESLAHYDVKMYFSDPKVKNDVKDQLTRRGIRSDLKSERRLVRRKNK